MNHRSVSTAAGAISLMAVTLITDCAKTRTDPPPLTVRVPNVPDLATPDAATVSNAVPASDVAGGQAVGEAGTSDAQADPSPELGCPITESFAAMLSDDCVVDPGLDTTPCPLEGASCLRFENADGPNESRSVCFATCWLGSRLEWSVGCTSECRHACAEPAPETPSYELDVSDCAQRAVVACPSGSVTAQGQLDNMLRALVANANLSLQEVYEDSLVVHFEGGCARRFHAKSRPSPLVTLEPALRELLGGLRWDCAARLECGEVRGPSTVASE